VRNDIFVSDDFAPAIYGLHLSYGIRKSNFLYALNISIGASRTRIKSRDVPTFIESENIRINPKINYVLDGVTDKTNLSFGFGPSLILADFRRITSTDISLSIYEGRSFIDFGWSGSLDLQFFINRNLGLKVPLAVEYYHNSKFTSFNAGLGFVWRF